MACLYCRRDRPAVQITESHVFPRNLGGTVVVPELVCHQCNSGIGQELEWPARRTFAPFLSWWGIRGGSRQPPPVPVTLKFGDLQTHAVVNGRGEAVEVRPIGVVDGTGRRRLIKIGPAAEVEGFLTRIQKRRPGWKWTELDLATLPPPVIEGTLPTDGLVAPRMRRLAAKIALEALARHRRAAALDREYDETRRFIREGAEPARPVAGLLWHEQIMMKYLQVPLPMHMVALVKHPRDRIFGGFVAFFGLYYYWVILSQNHAALAPDDRVLLVHPQYGTIFEPRLRTTLLPPVVPWKEVLTGSADQEVTLRRESEFAIRKLRQALADVPR